MTVMSNTMRRCESKTTKGTRCKREAKVYHRHTDGKEYLSCIEHEKRFTPCKSAQELPS